jgi:hypothetical protein
MINRAKQRIAGAARQGWLVCYREAPNAPAREVPRPDWAKAVQRERRSTAPRAHRSHDRPPAASSLLPPTLLFAVGVSFWPTNALATIPESWLPLQPTMQAEMLFFPENWLILRRTRTGATTGADALVRIRVPSWATNASSTRPFFDILIPQLTSPTSAATLLPG